MYRKEMGDVSKLIHIGKMDHREVGSYTHIEDGLLYIFLIVGINLLAASYFHKTLCLNSYM